MYPGLKKLLITLLPHSFLIRNEKIFRAPIYLFYKGSRYRCNICGKGLTRFVRQNNDDKLCPSCGSISRTRRLWQLLQSGYLRRGVNILDFSPSRSIYRAFKRFQGVSYTSTDLSGTFIADVRYDITSIPVQDYHFDLVICYHVLEHIPNDRKAMDEMFRVLKKGGTCLVQTPFRAGEVYENELINTNLERLRHFGQEDHVRIYSPEGLKERMEYSGFHVETISFQEPENNPSGFSAKECVLFCTKPGG